VKTVARLRALLLPDSLREVSYVSRDATWGISCKHLAGMFLSS
jgi:hypothetical protein